MQEIIVNIVQQKNNEIQHFRLFFLFFYLIEFLRGGRYMEIKSRIVNKTLYILLSGDLDEYTAQSVRKKLDVLLDTQKGFVQIVIDLSELTFMDSTGVGVLIGRYKKMRETNKPIFITNPSRNAERIFKMSGLYEIMPKLV